MVPPTEQPSGELVKPAATAILAPAQGRGVGGGNSPAADRGQRQRAASPALASCRGPIPPLT
jgi:hypothetical protein